MVTENKYLLNGRYIFDANAKSLTSNGSSNNTTWLGSNESNILLAFIERPDQILSRDKIHQLVWTDNGFHVDESSVIQAISTLRKILQDSTKDPSYIKTIPKHGYQFIAKCKRLPLEDNTLKDVPPIQTNQRQEKNKKITNKFFTTGFLFLLLSVLGIMIIVFFRLPMALENKKYTKLQQVDTIYNVDIYTLESFHEFYNLQPEIKHCTTQLLVNNLQPDTIDKIIVSSTSRNELVINVIGQYLSNSASYTLISKNIDMNLFCDIRLNSDEK